MEVMEVMVGMEGDGGVGMEVMEGDGGEEGDGGGGG